MKQHSEPGSFVVATMKTSGGDDASPDVAGLNTAYTGVRRDVASLIPGDVDSVLDVGCAAGALGSHLKLRTPGITVDGIEADATMARLAEQHLDHVFSGTVEDYLATWSGRSYDVVVLADVLEHLVNPWGVLRDLSSIAARFVVISVPNIAFYTTHTSLLGRRRWPYKTRGVHDRTHLHQFAYWNLIELVYGAGLSPTRIDRNYRLVDRPHAVNHVARAIGPVPYLRELFTYQFLVLAAPEARLG
jgi:trans-aconitate methyltransferase